MTIGSRIMQRSSIRKTAFNIHISASSQVLFDRFDVSAYDSLVN